MCLTNTSPLALPPAGFWCQALPILKQTLFLGRMNYPSITSFSAGTIFVKTAFNMTI